MKKFETFEHTADIGLRAYGKSLEEAFENAAYGMFKIMYSKLEEVKPKLSCDIECEGYDIESLFVEWLNTLLYKSSSSNIVFSHFVIKELDLKKCSLIAVVKGEKFNKRFLPQLEVKAATYSQLKVVKEKNVYIVQCVLDI